jgi:CBS domain-containing protein
MATKILDVMTRHPRAVDTQTSVREAARLMEVDDVGSLPVVEDGARLVGVVTDRDIALRVVAQGLDPERTSVSQVASQDVLTLTPEDDLDDALRLMARAQVRRVPIVVRDHELVGMLSQADLGQAAKEKRVGEVVEAISRRPKGPRVGGGDLAEPEREDAHDELSERRTDPARDREK